MKEYFFAELRRRLSVMGIPSADPLGGWLPILWGGEPVVFVSRSGDVFFEKNRVKLYGFALFFFQNRLKKGNENFNFCFFGKRKGPILNKIRIGPFSVRRPGGKITPAARGRR